MQTREALRKAAEPSGDDRLTRLAAVGAYPVPDTQKGGGLNNETLGGQASMRDRVEIIAEHRGTLLASRR